MLRKLALDKYFPALLELTLSALTGFLVGAVVLAVLGYDPLKVYSVLFSRGFTDVDYLLSRSTPLMLTGIAFSVPAIAGFFNIGGESQLYVGALTSLLVAYYTGNPVLAILAGALVGASLGALIAVLRVYRGVNEVITAIMINWSTYFFMLFLLVGHLYDPLIPHQSIPVPEAARLGRLGGVRLIFYLAVAASVAMYFIVYHTNLGYVLRVSGMSPKASKYAGFDPGKAAIYSMLLGGAYAGLGGALLVLGFTYAIDTLMSALFGLGFMGIGVGLMGRNNPLGIILSAIFFSGLIIGGEMVELRVGTPPELTDVLIGVIVVSLALSYAYRLLISRIKLAGWVK